MEAYAMAGNMPPVNPLPGTRSAIAPDGMLRVTFSAKRRPARVDKTCPPPATRPGVVH